MIDRLDPAKVEENLAAVRGRIEAAARRGGRDPAAVTLLAATKYVPAHQLAVLLEAGLTVFGENRAQDLVEKAKLVGGAARFDFIGALQSRRVAEIAPYVHLIHTVASRSALRALERHPPASGAGVLIQVNLSGEPQKAGVAAEAVGELIAACPLEVVGLMTLPPLSEDPERSRPYFRALRELARRHGLRELSMGTSQDFEVAVEEGATIVRIGTSLYL